MRWRQPDPHEPELLAWWQPLIYAARNARENQVPWMIHLDEFALEGWAERSRRPAVFVYTHRRTGRRLMVDVHGDAYDYRPHRAGRSAGHFQRISVSQAVWLAGLPEVVEPVWNESRHGRGPVCEPADDAQASMLPAVPEKRRGHLRLLNGRD
jgi:hypothetical protein